jgi:hypothetical protein
MRRTALLGAFSLALLVVSIVPSVASAAAFEQCPPVRKDAGCQFLITVTNSGVPVAEDPSQGPYDGEDDTLVGIKNSSSKTISSIPLSAEETIFGFDGEGICRPSGTEPIPSGCVVLAKNSENVKTAKPGTKCSSTETEACGFPPPPGEPPNVTFEPGISISGFAENGDAVTGYEGPTSWFTNLSSTSRSGVVNFSPALAPGQQTYFGLEAALTGKSITVGNPTTLSTTLSGGGQSGPSISVVQGTPVADTAALGGAGAAVAEGAASYSVYGDSLCTKLVAAAGSGAFSHGVAAASTPQTLAPGKYYWRASYPGDLNNQAVVSACGTEILTVLAATTTTTIQSTGKALGASLAVRVGTAVSDQAVIAGALAKSATGTVSYTLYKDSKCTVPALAGSVATVLAGAAGASAPVKPAVGTYYWTASYSGDAVNAPSASACGSEVLLVAKKASLGLSGKKGCVSHRKFPIHPKGPRGVKLVSFEEFINGTLAKKGRLSKRQTTVNLVGLPKGTFEVELTTKSSKGETYEDTRTFHTCVPKAKKGKKHK